MYHIKFRRFSYVINTEGSVYLLHPLGCSVDCVVVIGGSLDVRSYHTGKEQLNDKTSGIDKNHARICGGLLT